MVGNDGVLGQNGTCTIEIEKLSGGKKCGFRAFVESVSGVKILRILTKPKGNAKNCEMCIHLDVPRLIHIGIPPSSIF